MPTEVPERSYRALTGVPGLPRVLAGMLLSRVAEGMTAIAFILFTLQRFGDPSLAGWVTFCSILPGLLVSPLVGALLDRHGRTRLVVLDLSIAGTALWTLAVLAIADALTPALLLGIVSLSSLTGPLSRTGLRSLFPIIVPRHLWERANAIDSNGYVLSVLVGPPAAGALVQLIGGPTTLAVIGVVYAVSAVILVRAPDPDVASQTSGRILRDALDGLLYTVRHRTLAALAVSMSALNIGGGIIVIVVPLLILERLGGSETTVGLVFAIQGIAGLVTALVIGRINSLGRERLMIALAMAGMSVATALLVFPSVLSIALMMAAMGLLTGPLDVALFTVRQRRTDPAWMGRSFAISMSLNFLGYPIGSAIAGALGVGGIEPAVVVAVIAIAVGAVISWVFIPATQPAFSPGPAG